MKVPERHLIFGSPLFGIGWGAFAIAGAAPDFGQPPNIVFVAAMLGGMIPLTAWPNAPAMGVKPWAVQIPATVAGADGS